MLRFAAIFLAGATLTACATLSEAECVSGDWRTIGFSDGASGQTLDRVGRHQEACAQHGVGVDLAMWRFGYDEGLERYCTPQNALQVGARGESYQGVCPPSLDAGFLPAYGDGRRLYDLRQAVEAARSRAYEIDHRVYELRDDLDDARDRRNDTSLTQEERDAANREVVRLKDDIRDYESDSYRYDSDVSRLEAELASYEAWLGATYSGWGW